MKRKYSKPVVLISKTFGTDAMLAGSDPSTITTPINNDGHATEPAGARGLFGYDGFGYDGFSSERDDFPSNDSKSLWED